MQSRRRTAQHSAGGRITRNDGKDGVSIRVEQVIVLRSNGGGPIMRVKTLNGDINILKANQ